MTLDVRLNQLQCMLFRTAGAFIALIHRYSYHMEALHTVRSHSKVSSWFTVSPAPLLLCRRVNYKLINRPARLGDPLIRGDVQRQENKGLFLSRCAQ